MKKISLFLFSLALSLGSFKGSCPNRKKIPEQNYARSKFFFHNIYKKLEFNESFLNTVSDNSFLMEFIQESSGLPEDEKKYLFRKIFPYFLENVTYEVLQKNTQLEEYKKLFFSEFDNFIDTIYQKHNKNEALRLFEKYFRIFYDFLLDENALSEENVHAVLDKIKKKVDMKVELFEKTKIFDFTIYFNEDSENSEDSGEEENQEVRVRVKIKSVANFKEKKTFYYTYKTQNIQEIKEESVDKEISEEKTKKLKEKEEKRKNIIKETLEEEIAIQRAIHYRRKFILFPDEEKDLSSVQSCNINGFLAKEISFYKIQKLYTTIKDDDNFLDSASPFMDCLNFIANSLRFKNIKPKWFFFKKENFIRKLLGRRLQIENFYDNFKEKIFQKNQNGYIFYLQDLLNSEFSALQNALVQHYPSEFDKEVFFILPRQHVVKKISLKDFLWSFDSGVEIDTFALDLKNFFNNLSDYIKNKCLTSDSKPISTLTAEDIEAMKELKKFSFRTKKEKQHIIFEDLVLSFAMFADGSKLTDGLKNRDFIKTLKIHKNFFPSSQEDGAMLRDFFSSEKFEDEETSFPSSQEDGKMLRDFFSSEEE